MLKNLLSIQTCFQMYLEFQVSLTVTGEERRRKL